MSVEYTLSCWYSRQNPATFSFKQLLFQTHTLVKALQARLNDGEVVVPSRDQDSTRLGIEIVVMHKSRVKKSYYSYVANILNELAALNRYEYKDFTPGKQCLTCYFSADQVKDIELLKVSSDFNITEAQIQSVIDAKKDPTAAAGIPGNQITEPFQITPSRYNRLKDARGESVRKELIGLMDALNAAKNSVKTGWATILMIASGMVTVGGWMKTLSTIWGGALTAKAIAAIPTVTAAIGVAGLAGLIAGLIAVVALIVGGLYLALKDTMNILLVVNNTSDTIEFKGDQPINGERGSVTGTLPPKYDDGRVWAGFYMYRKFNLVGNPLGFYGSLFGAAFSANEASVSIGMDCPNSLLGGTNSVRLHPGLDPLKAASMANESNNSEDEVETMSNANSSGYYRMLEHKLAMHGKTWHARRADSWGNINWATCVVYE